MNKIPLFLLAALSIICASINCGDGLGGLFDNNQYLLSGSSSIDGDNPEPDRGSNLVVTSILPNAGQNSDIISITNISGENFATGATVTLNTGTGVDVSASAVSVISSTQIACEFDITDKNAGLRDVVVTNPDLKSATLTDGFNITEQSLTIDSIIPNSGANTGTISMTDLAGTGFQSGATVTLDTAAGIDVTGVNVIVVSSTQITCDFDITGKDVGLRDIVVTNPDLKSAILTDGFTITEQPLTIDSIGPNSGINTGIISITDLAGTGFQPGAAVTLNIGAAVDVIGANVIVVSSTQITCDFDITGKNAGLRDIVVTNPDFETTVLIDGFSITEQPLLVDSIGPNTGLNTGIVSITDLSGAGFDSGAIVSLNVGAVADVTADNVIVVSDTQITCDFDITNKSAGLRDVVVTNPDLETFSLIDGFAITEQALSFASIDPNIGVNTGTASITDLSGTGFQTGAAVTLNIGAAVDVTATNVTVVTPLQITCDFDLNGKTSGLRDVVVTNPDLNSITLTDGFAITDPGPNISSITPGNGENTGAISITDLSGSNFVTGATVKITMSGEPDIDATGVNVVGPGQITCDLDLTGSKPGEYDVVVINPDLQSGTLTNGFRVTGWYQINADADWAKRRDPTAAVHDGKMWVIGGSYDIGASNVLNDVWNSTDGITWIEATDDANWTARSRHSSVVFDDKIWVIGGRDENDWLDDVWSSTDGITWTEISSSATGTGRADHTSVVFDGKMWILGGLDETISKLNDVWYSTDGIVWNEATDDANWTERKNHASLVFDGKMWVIAGDDDVAPLDCQDVWYSTNGIDWTEATPDAEWNSKQGLSAVAYRSKIWIMAGRISGFNDAWYSSDGITWTSQTANAPWDERMDQKSVVYDDKIWFMGGYQGPFDYRNDVWIYFE